MSIERAFFNGPIAFRCDGDRCHEFDETRSSDFSSALAKAKSHGWTTKRRGDEWFHLCPDCSE